MEVFQQDFFGGWELWREVKKYSRTRQRRLRLRITTNRGESKAYLGRSREKRPSKANRFLHITEQNHASDRSLCEITIQGQNNVMTVDLGCKARSHWATLVLTTEIINHAWKSGKKITTALPVFDQQARSSFMLPESKDKTVCHADTQSAVFCRVLQEVHLVYSTKPLIKTESEVCFFPLV